MSESNSEKAKANVEIMGYSERGCLNAVLYDIRYHEKSLDILKELLNNIRSPFLSDLNEPKFKDITKAEILIEQSFSEFGDADAVFMIEHPEDKSIIFLEAKVGARYHIDKALDKFNEGKNKKEKIQGFSSNLFTQLYYKYKMIESLKKDGLNGLQKGVVFNEYSPNKPQRKIGRNQVVRKAVDKLKNCLGGTDDKAEVYYVALIPNETETKKVFNKENNKDLPYGNNECIGYVTWESIENFCQEKKLNNAIKAFKYNNGQIYKK